MREHEKQLEYIINDSNSFQKQALNTIARCEELEVHNYLLRKALTDLFNGGWDDEHVILISNQAKIALEYTPEQCLNSVKTEAVEEFIELVISDDDKNAGFGGLLRLMQGKYNKSKS